MSEEVEQEGTEEQTNTPSGALSNKGSESEDDRPLTRSDFARLMGEYNGKGQSRPSPVPSRSSSGFGLDRDELNRILDERESRKSSQDEVASLKAEVAELRDTLKKRTRKVFSPWGF